jgi:hypothetical protein
MTEKNYIDISREINKILNNPKSLVFQAYKQGALDGWPGLKYSHFENHASCP